MQNKLLHKKDIHFIILLLFSFYLFSVYSTIYGQIINDKTYLYLEVDELPMFGENKDEVFKYIFLNLTWPKHFDGSGEVLISFVVNEQGKLENIFYS